MKKIFFGLLFLGGCLASFALGFHSEQIVSSIANRGGIQVETEKLKMNIVFKSEASKSAPHR